MYVGCRLYSAYNFVQIGKLRLLQIQFVLLTQRIEKLERRLGVEEQKNIAGDQHNDSDNLRRLLEIEGPATATCVSLYSEGKSV